MPKMSKTNLNQKRKSEIIICSIISKLLLFHSQKMLSFDHEWKKQNLARIQIKSLHNAIDKKTISWNNWATIFIVIENTFSLKLQSINNWETSNQLLVHIFT
jgi:hypothetical protein